MADVQTTAAKPAVSDRLRRTWSLALLAVVLIADRWSKLWILNDIKLPEVGRIEVSSIFSLTFTWNRGVSFGALKADGDLGRWALIVLSLGIAGWFGWWMWNTSRKLASAALALIVGGALGNLVDRVSYGAVVDFLDFSALHFPWIFNIADSAITVGAALLALDFLLEAREERAAAASGAKGSDSAPAA